MGQLLIFMRKRHLIALVIPILIFSKAQSQQQVDSVFKKDLMQLAYKRIEAFDLGDTSIWSPYVANEYIIATPTGKVITKADVMKGFGPALKGYRDAFRFEDVYVIRDSAVAVMSYTIKEHEWWGSQQNDLPDLRKTDTYILKGGKWLLLASHETFYPIHRKTVTIDPKTYNSYIGKYQVMPSLIYTVSNEKGKLMIRENNSLEKTALFPLSSNVFFSKPNTGFFNEGGVGEVIFTKGKVDYLIFRRYGVDIKAQKIK